jgi:hypothetical protein
VKWLKNAFAIDPPGPAEPTPDQKVAVDKVCAEVVRRRLTSPAILFLESSRPLNYLGSQVLHFFTPFVTVLTDSRAPGDFAEFLSQRGAIDYMCQKIEDLDEEARLQDKKSSTPTTDETETTAETEN